ncbi:MAG: IS3 family transposase, partial [Pseudomonadota bacterium]
MIRIREIAQTRVRCGYTLPGRQAKRRREGRIYVLLRRGGWDVNHKRVCRLYRTMGLLLRNCLAPYVWATDVR